MSEGNLNVSATLTRTHLGLPNLLLHETTGYYIQRNSIGPGEISFRKNYVQSPFVRGQVLVHAVKDLQTSVIKVRVQGSSEIDLVNKMEEMCEAFEQPSYTMTIVVGGHGQALLCDPADYSIGESGQWDDLMYRSFTQNVTFTVPHAPVASGFR